MKNKFYYKIKHYFANSLSICLILSLSTITYANTKTASSGKISKSEPKNAVQTINDLVATEDYLAEIDERAEQLKNEILNSETEINVTGTIYYVSNNGNDSNDGKSPERAWATLSKVNKATLGKGDAVLFERGGIWRGQLTTKSGVTYSAYGEGDKPKLYNSVQAADPELWIETDMENVYEYAETFPFSNEPGNIIFNEGEACGIKKIVGEYEYYKERGLELEKFTGVKDLDENLEFYHHIPTGKLYLYCEEGNPGELYSSIEIALRQTIIKNQSANNVTIDNLCIKYTGSHGIGSWTCNDLTVTNCEFGWIGGSIQAEATPYYRFGNAIEIYGGCDGYTVRNCYIHQIYDAGVTHQLDATEDTLMNNINYVNNLFEYCTYSIEYWLDKKSGSSPKLLMSNIIIKDNISRFVGLGWGDQRPNKEQAAHIKGWDRMNPAENFVIENNIFDRSKYMILHIGASDAASLPEMKNNTYIQFPDEKFGRFGLVPTKVVMFDQNISTYIKNNLKENGAEVRYALPEGMTKLPFNYIENGGDTKTFLSYTYTAKDGTTLPFKVILPDNYDENKKYPLLLYLHSQNERGNDNISQFNGNNSYIIDRLYNETNPDYDCIILAPQCPSLGKWVDVTSWSKGNYSIDEIPESKYLAAVVDLVKDIQEIYSVDENRLYAAGVSMGGYGVWDIAARHPGMFKAIIPVSGAGDVSKAKNFKGTAVWVFHRKNDYTVDSKYSKAMVEALKAAGVDVKYDEYNDITTECWEKEDLLEWLFKQ